MKLLKLSSIIVPENRQRKTFDNAKIKELAESIKNVGLLHPPVITFTPDGQAILRAGERRLRALETIKEEYFCNGQLVAEGYTLCTLTAELDEIEVREVELDENIRRVDLTWQERAGAINQLAELRRLQNPEVSKGEIAQEIAETTNSTMAGAYTELSRSTFVAQHMDDPKVAQARSLKEAYTIATRKDEAVFTSALARVVGDTSSEHRIICGDCISEMSNLTPGSVDAIIADPPYGMGADSFGDAGPAHQYADDAETALEIARQIILHGLVICKEQAHLYMFCDIEHFFSLRDFAAKNGWKPFRTPLIWDKGAQMGHNPIPDQGIRRTYETILYCYRGNRPGLVFMSDIIRGINSISSPTHPAEKPAPLYKHLLERSCRPGEIALDPTCGTGPVFEAANMLRLKAIGIDKDKEYAELAAARRTRGVSGGAGIAPPSPDRGTDEHSIEDL